MDVIRVISYVILMNKLVRLYIDWTTKRITMMLHIRIVMYTKEPKDDSQIQCIES